MGEGDAPIIRLTVERCGFNGLPAREGVESVEVMLLSIKEAAGRLGVGRDSVVRLIRNGKLPCVEFPIMGGKGKNKKIEVDDKDIDGFIQRHRKGKK